MPKDQNQLSQQTIDKIFSEKEFIKCARLIEAMWRLTMAHTDWIDSTITKMYGNQVYVYFYDIVSNHRLTTSGIVLALKRLESEAPEVFKVLSKPEFYGRILTMASLEGVL